MMGSNDGIIRRRMTRTMMVMNRTEEGGRGDGDGDGDNSIVGLLW